MVICYSNPHLNPVAPEPPITAYADPRSFYRWWRHQFYWSRTTVFLLCPLACAEWRALSNRTRMSSIQSRTLEKKEKKHVTLTWKLPCQWKSCSTTRLPFLSSHSKILKAFFKTFPTKMKPTQCPGRKIEARKVKKREERKRNVIVKTAVSLLNPKTISKVCFLCMPELRKLIFCIWIRSLRRVRPVNGLRVSLYSTTVTRKLLD